MKSATENWQKKRSTVHSVSVCTATGCEGKIGKTALWTVYKQIHSPLKHSKVPKCPSKHFSEKLRLSLHETCIV